MIDHFVLFLICRITCILLHALHHFEGYKLLGRRLLHTSPVYRIPECLLSLGLFNLINVRVVLIKHINLACVHEFTIRADRRIRVLVADQIL